MTQMKIKSEGINIGDTIVIDNKITGKVFRVTASQGTVNYHVKLTNGRTMIVRAY